MRRKGATSADLLRLLAVTLLVAGGLYAVFRIFQRAAMGHEEEIAAADAPRGQDRFPTAGPAARTDLPDAGSGLESVRLEEIPADEWLGEGAVPLSGEDLLGDVVLMEFWTYLCFNCKNVEPWMKRIHREYSSRGLQVIAVHTPEFEVERKVANVREYLEENGIEYAVAIDNGWRVWRKYNTTHAWPSFLVFDRQGSLIYRRAGEGAVHGAEAAIEKALGTVGQRPADARAASAPGIRFRAQASRSDGRQAALEISLEAEPGFRLVRSPPNEILLEVGAGLAGPLDPVLLGEAFTGTDAGDLRYYEGEATLRIPLEVTVDAADTPLVVRGTAIYRVCDDRAGTCSRHETDFSEVVPGVPPVDRSALGEALSPFTVVALRSGR